MDEKQKKYRLEGFSACLTCTSVDGVFYSEVPGLTLFYNNKNERDYAASRANKMPHYLHHSKTDHNFRKFNQYWLHIYFNKEAYEDWI